ncbi:CHY zinc finger protein [Arthrobacter sp.]|uniref:CHY zinc finger protein n=1 Tax=Arthrobacter sp. TaxID=1667 RepID=UPI0028123524|nr:CHY zinc finger protein [Arthrobacter sp.]
MRVLGPTVDDQTRCIHYRTVLDVVAIKFKCCGEFYPCHLCHAETADHAAAVWPAGEQDTEAILCGVCKETMRIRDYLGADACSSCRAPFNPGCRLHKHLYFGTDEGLDAAVPQVGLEPTL